MKTKISLQCPSVGLILYSERNEMGGADGDEMFACDYTGCETI